MRVKFIFAWYDMWIGAFYDRTKRRLYVFPVPCVGFYVERSNAEGKSKQCEFISDWHQPARCQNCGRRREDHAFRSAE